MFSQDIYNHSLICAICQPENLPPDITVSAEGCFFVGQPEKFALKKMHG